MEEERQTRQAFHSCNSVRHGISLHTRSNRCSNRMVLDLGIRFKYNGKAVSLRCSILPTDRPVSQDWELFKPNALWSLSYAKEKEELRIRQIQR